MFNVDGEEYNLKFTIGALEGLEKTLKAPIVQILENFSNGKVGVTDLVTLVWAGLEGYRKSERTGTKQYTRNDAINIVESCKFLPTFTKVGELLAEALGAGEDEEKN